MSSYEDFVVDRQLETKIEQRQESGIHQVIIDTNRPVTKTQLEKVKKMFSNGKAKSTGEELSKSDEIINFLKTYNSETKLNDVPVKEMRHIIPLLHMAVYVEKYGHYTKKVKGLWEKRPDDWPNNIPFVDPNNKLKNEGEQNRKPKKELLGQMLHYLIKRYKDKEEESKESNLTHDSFLSLKNQPDDQHLFDFFGLNLIETNEPEETVHTSGSVDESLATFSGHSSASISNDPYFSAIQRSLFSSVPSDGRSLVSCASIHEMGEYLSCVNLDDSRDTSQFLKLPVIDKPEKQPEQAVDNEDANCEEEWDPLSELQQRICRKLNFLRKTKFMSDNDLEILEHSFNSIVELTRKSHSVDEQCVGIDKLHMLEKQIDIKKFTSTTEKSKQMPVNLEDEFVKKPDLGEKKIEKESGCYDFDSLQDNVVDLIPADNPSLIKSLNIKTRQGMPAPSMAVENLQVRSVAGLQKNVQPFKGISLSDNYKPVQPADEDNQVPFLPALQLEELQDLFSGFFSDDSGNASDEVSKPIQETEGLCMPSSVGSNVPETGMTLFTSDNSQPLDFETTLHHNGSLPLLMYTLKYQPKSADLDAMGFQSAAAHFSMEFQPNSAATFGSQQPASNSGSVPPTGRNPSWNKPLSSNNIQLHQKQIRPGGKRSYLPEDDDSDKMDTDAPFKPETEYQNNPVNQMIPVMVEEYSNNPDRPYSRTKKKPRM